MTLSDALHVLPVACEAVSVRYSSVTDACFLRLAKMPFVFSHIEYCDMHFVYGFCNGSALGLRLDAYLLEFTRHCVTLVVFQVLKCAQKGR